MGFGTSYSLVHVDCLDWVHTMIHFRILRSVVGGAIVGTVYWLFTLIPAHDNPTRYFFHFAVPALLLSFFIYGLYPVFCLKIGLVKPRPPKTQSSTNSILTTESVEKKPKKKISIEEESVDNESKKSLLSEGKENKK